MAFACIAHLGLVGCSRALRLFFGPAGGLDGCRTAEAGHRPLLGALDIRPIECAKVNPVLDMIWNKNEFGSQYLDC